MDAKHKSAFETADTHLSHDAAVAVVSPTATPPVKVGEIPGLGPIRARALTKAGLGDAMGLRAATMEQLIAVPGVSEIKARHIQSYLAQFSVEALQQAAEAAYRQTPNDAPGPAGAAPAPQGMTHGQPEALLPPSLPPVAPSALVDPAQQVLNMAIRLLMSEPATGYRARLLRETIGFMRLVALLLECGPLPDKAQERALRRLHAALVTLAAAVAQPDMDRKEQTRLADQLAQVRERLETLVGQTLRHRPAEAEDE